MHAQAKEPVTSAKAFDAGDVGAFLRARRRELGYTQEQVALMMGCSPRLVGELERGRATVGLGRVLTYAQGLGVNVTLSVRGRR